MATVETVRGPVQVGDLGPTLMHEHIFALSTEHVQNYGDGLWWDEDVRMADAVSKLRALHHKGIKTIVDPTVWGLGRYIPRIQRIAEQVDLNIVVAAGLYVYEELPQQYAYRGPGLLFDVPEPMITDFTRDIAEGIGTSGVKAALLKCCVDAAGLTPGIDRIARAVARTHLGTGAPITVHTSSPAQSGRLAVDLFRSEGVDLAKVVIAHAGDSNDLDYLMELADTGATLGMDRFGLDLFNPTPDRIWTIAAWPHVAMPTGWCSRTTRTASSTTSAPTRTQPGQRSYPTGTTRTSATMCCSSARIRRDRGAFRTDAGGQPAPLLQRERFLIMFTRNKS